MYNQTEEVRGSLPSFDSLGKNFIGFVSLYAGPSVFGWFIWMGFSFPLPSYSLRVVSLLDSWFLEGKNWGIFLILVLCLSHSIAHGIPLISVLCFDTVLASHKEESSLSFASTARHGDSLFLPCVFIYTNAYVSTERYKVSQMILYCVSHVFGLSDTKKLNIISVRSQLSGLARSVGCVCVCREDER